MPCTNFVHPDFSRYYWSKLNDTAFFNENLHYGFIWRHLHDQGDVSQPRWGKAPEKDLRWWFFFISPLTSDYISSIYKYLTKKSTRSAKFLWRILYVVSISNLEFLTKKNNKQILLQQLHFQNDINNSLSLNPYPNTAVGKRHSFIFSPITAVAERLLSLHFPWSVVVVAAFQMD